jgi:superfamily I DNA/RNA helicase
MSGTYDYRQIQAADEDQQEEAFAELEVADYLVFLLAFDTYLRWLKETGQRADHVFGRGLMLLKMMERDHLEKVNSVLATGVTNPGSLKMLQAAMRLPSSTSGASMRALKLRTIVSRGGTATAKHIFGTSIRARKEVTDAIEAATTDDAPTALTKFAGITLKNKRLEKWIRGAADTAGKPFVAVNPAHEATKQVAEDGEVLRDQKIAQDAARPDSEAHADAQVAQANTLARIENAATEAAAKALETVKGPDAPVTRSQATGIATAVATAVANDPRDLKNIPPAFINKGIPLDPEQMDAAQTNGKVLVAAGAGAGKSTTLVSRVAYLVDNQGTNPTRIMAVTFNKKAAFELQEKLQKKLGADRGKSVVCDTMHTVFRKFIIGDPKMGIPAYGTPEEVRMMTQDLIAPPRPGVMSKVKPGDISRAINTMWNQCNPDQLAAYTGWPKSTFEEGAPKSKKAGLYINKWAGNDVSYTEAKANARAGKEQLAAIYYEFYLGLKGDIPNWRPPCGGDGFSKFMDRYRRGRERLGDMDDMLKIFRDILRRDPKAKAAIQGTFDHILIDEAQDSNTIQHQIFDMMSEKIECDDKKKSIWLVGDDRQAIYQFRGAKPELFQKHWGDGCWKPKMIRTNYRCPPEVVEVANKLVSYNEDRLPVDAMPSPYKARGEASVHLEIEGDNAAAAIDTLHDIRKDLDEDPKKYRPEDYAVLARTNKELNDFETACIINEIPYMRRGGHGFLDAPESRAVLGYIDLASGTNFEKKQKSLVDALMKPDRGLFLGPDKIEIAVKEAVDDVARYEHKDVKDVDPEIILTSRDYSRRLAEYLKGPYKNQLMAKGQWLWNKVVDQLQRQILDMGRDVGDIRRMTMGGPDVKTQQLLEFVLDNVKGTQTNWDPNIRREVTTVQTLRENITQQLKLSDDADDDDDETTSDDESKPKLDEEGRPVVEKKEEAEENPAKGLGAVQFLYALSEPNKNDHDLGILPDTAAGFTKKLERYAKIAETLRIDLRAWEKQQARITDPALRQEKPPAVTLTTVHAVKGLEWPHVTVLMPKGVFPIELKRKKGEPPPTPEEQKEHDISERNLAYVALTRAAKNLSVISIPDPKSGAQSPYIEQSGLAPGENVPKAQAPTPVPEVVTAGDFTVAKDEADLDSEAVASIAMWPDDAGPISNYDRRTQ